MPEAKPYIGTRRFRLLEGVDRFTALLAKELALRPHRVGTSLRWATIATIGAGLMAACHVDSVLGPYIVWLMLGPVAMMSPRMAVGYLAVTGALLAASVPLAGILAEAPWLMLSFVGIFTALSTYQINTRKLGAIGLVWQVVTLDSFYAVVFAPGNFGWSDAALFGGCAIAFGLIAVFDTWIWPQPAEAVLLESLAASLDRMRVRFLQASTFYLDERAAQRPPEPPATSETPVQLELLDRAASEGIGAHRRGVLLGATTVVERLHIRVDRIAILAREELPRGVRTMIRPELELVRNAIADALEELARETRVSIRTGVDEPPSPASARVRPALDTMDARIGEVRHLYIGRAGGAEIANFAALTENLHGIGRLVERPLDEPPLPAESGQAPTHAASQPDPAMVRYCLKVALCLMVGYLTGLTTQRADLSTILTTIIVTALPTYGASLRKTILRIVGAILGGAVSLLAIVMVTPNFETLPSYMFVTFIVLLISGYVSLSSGRVAYAGKQLGTTYLLVFAGLRPALDVYSPLWRAWGILLGTIVVTVIFFILWPEYAGDSLLPRLRKVIRNTLMLMPGGAWAGSEGEIETASNEITQVLSEILQVADDARIEGRKSLIDHDAVVSSAGTIRRIAHRLAASAIRRITDPLPGLDDATQAARDATFAAIRRRLEVWLAFYQSNQSLNGVAARALAAGHSRDEIARPMEEFAGRVEADGFALIAAWTLEQRRRILAELQSLRRLEFLMFELDTYLSSIPGAAPAAELAQAAAVVARHPA
jgi:uncharacterized membrane protein YccC